LPESARARVLGIQRKLHKWAIDDQDRRFDDLHNLVCDPAVLMVAWCRVRSNTGSRSAGVDGQTARHVEQQVGVETFLDGLREELRSGSFRPLPVKERKIPKRGGKLRRLGVPTVRDRVVQAALKTVLEPIFEADFQPCSYGFRPGRRAHDAIAEIHMLATNSYEWVLEADITACFDEISHAAALERLRTRIADKRVMTLIKAFLKAGILTELGGQEETLAGTPQGGILSPLIANVTLSALDEHFARAWQTTMATRPARESIRRHGGATYRLIRYADDFVVCVAGGREHAEALRTEVEQVLAPLGLRLSAEKTRVSSIDDGFDFLGFAIKRVRGRHGRMVIHTYPSKRALASVKAKVRQITKHTGPDQAPDQLLQRVNRAARLVQLLPLRRLIADVRLPAPLRLPASGRLAAPPTPQAELELAAPHLPHGAVARPQRRGTLQPGRARHQPIPLPRREDPAAVDGRLRRTTRSRHGHGPPGRTDRQMTTRRLVESPVRGNSHAGFGGRPAETERPKAATAPRADPTSRSARSTRSAATSGTPTTAPRPRPASGSRAPAGRC
jgi:RNA-directed DNA polymerase